MNLLNDILNNLDTILEKKYPLNKPSFICKSLQVSSDGSEGLLYGIFSKANIEDLQGDSFTNEELEKMAHKAMINLANGDFVIKIDHTYVIDAYLVESYVDKLSDFFNWEWRGCIKIFDENIKQNAENGLYNGFSVGGEASKVEED